MQLIYARLRKRNKKTNNKRRSCIGTSLGVVLAEGNFQPSRDKTPRGPDNRAGMLFHRPKEKKRVVYLSNVTMGICKESQSSYPGEDRDSEHN